jgi:hypothetical protein
MEPAETDDLHLILKPGPPGTGTLEVRISPSHAHQLLGLVMSENLDHSEILELSAGSDLLIYAIPVAAAASIAALRLAKVLEAFFHRNDAKRWNFQVGDQVYSAEGCSREDAERWIKMALADRAELERRWADVRQNAAGGKQAESEGKADS